MRQLLRFSKMQGAGNDFVVIDAIRQKVNLTAAQIRYLADRHIGIGFDQLLLVEVPQTSDTDFYYRIFNADGSETGQCGNGARCLARFVVENGLTQKNHLRIQTQTSVLKLWFDNHEAITVNMGEPRFELQHIPLLMSEQATQYSFHVDNQIIMANALSMGNPHVVLTVDDIDRAPVISLGEKLARHTTLPQGANVGFMQVLNRNCIGLRVYERGTGETLACGSGACAAVITGIVNQQLDRDVRVILRGGDLTVSWPDNDSDVLLTGPAVTVFTGQIAVNNY